MSISWPLSNKSCPVCGENLFAISERCKCDDVEYTYVCAGGKGSKKKRKANQHRFLQCPLHKEKLVQFAPDLPEKLEEKVGRPVMKGDQKSDSGVCLCIE